jgi:ABC-type lipoprotein export system ATPase subunit
MIKLNNIFKYYDSKFQRSFVLKDICLNVREGEFISVMGPSGAGKSTLLNILGLLDEANEGEYFLYDQPVHRLKERKKVEYHRNLIGFIFQAYHLIDELNVYENIETPLIYKNIKSKERKAMVADILDRFNIVAKKELFPSQLSGGQQQLVGVARAIISNPRLLLADEPTGNLHSDQGKVIMELLQNLNKKEGMTIIQVTHSEENANYGNRIIRLEDAMITSETMSDSTKENAIVGA